MVVFGIFGCMGQFINLIPNRRQPSSFERNRHNMWYVQKGGIHVSGVGEGYGGYGYGSSVGAILVLFILLVIITRAFI